MPANGFTHEPRNSQIIDWYTPKYIFYALNLEFDLDPCSAGAGNDFVPAVHRYTISDDGLNRQWFGSVFCNPPYGKQTGYWLKKMSEHRNGVALVFARTGTKWWQEIAPTTDSICFVAGRIRFVNGFTKQISSAAGADSVLMAWGDVCSNAVKQSKLGMCMKLDAK